MLTRAKIVENYPNDDGTWNVFIPILMHMPMSIDDREALNKLSSERITKVSKNNYNPKDTTLIDFDIDSQQTESSVMSYDKYSSDIVSSNISNVLNKSTSTTNSKLSKYVQKATVCGILGLNYNFRQGDTVIITFENNDMAKPIIIGYLLTSDIIKQKEMSDNVTYPSLKLDQLVVNNNTRLPNDTEIDFSVNGDSFIFNKKFITDLFGEVGLGIPQDIQSGLIAHPIHSLYITTDPTNPAEIFGGFWEQIVDVFPFAASQLGSENPSYIPSENSKDGGSKDAVIVSHSHETYEYVWSAGSQWGETQQIPNSVRAVRHQLDDGSHNVHYNGTGDVIWYNTTNNFKSPDSSTEGVSGTDKNMPPYKIFYMWYRITEEELNAHLQ